MKLVEGNINGGAHCGNTLISNVVKNLNLNVSCVPISLSRRETTSVIWRLFIIS